MPFCQTCTVYVYFTATHALGMQTAPKTASTPAPATVYRLEPAGAEDEWPCEGGLAGYDSGDEARLERWVRQQQRRHAKAQRRKRFERDLAAAHAVVSALEAGAGRPGGGRQAKRRKTKT